MRHPRRSLAWILLHLTVIGLSVISLLTGLRIAAVSRPEVLAFSALLPQGYLHGLHFASALGLIAVVPAYLLYRLRRKDRPLVSRGGFHHRVGQLGYLLLPVLMLSGGLLYLGSPWALKDLHYYAALALPLYLLLHAGVLFVRYGVGVFTRILLPALPGKSDWVVLALVLTTFGLLFAGTTPGLQRTFTLQRIDPTVHINIDGIAGEAIWSKTQPVTVHTHGGANFTAGRTDVTLRGLSNGSEAFFHITWDDPTRSLRHLPLVREEQGWRVREDGFHRFDEQRFYEDKFALMLADNCDPGGSHSTWLGPRPLDHKPPNWHGKGYHYTNDGTTRDIWHWKAVRTNDMYLADDNFFGAPDDVRSGRRRYTAGYLPDAKESGGYVMNWQWYSPNGVLPQRLPKEASQLEPYQQPDAAGADWVIPWYGYQRYDGAQDHYLPGTVMPSVIYTSNRFEGDRADVQARAVWGNGRWSLELVRPLDTGSPHDVALKPGVCLWVAAFDHAQIAHTRHARPLRLGFGEGQ